MSGHCTERIDKECHIVNIIACAQQTVRIGMVGDWSTGGYDESETEEDMIRLTLRIIDPDPTCDPGELWLSRDDALHLSDVLRMFAITLERTLLQCGIADIAAREKEEKEAADS